MADDPFKKAIEEELREAASRGRTGSRAPDADPGGKGTDGPDPAVWGRPGDAAPGPREAEASGTARRAGVPSVGRRPDPRPDTTRAPDPALSDEAARAREAPDYVGDFETRGVPRWEPGDGDARPPAPTADRASADPAADPEAVPDGRLPPADTGMLSPGVGNARLCYFFNLAFFLGIVFLPLIGALMALTSRRRVGADLASHYTYAARTVGLGLVAAFLINLSAFTIPDLFGVLVVGWLVWFGVRSVRGLSRLGAGLAMPNPRTWLF